MRHTNTPSSPRQQVPLSFCGLCHGAHEPLEIRCHALLVLTSISDTLDRGVSNIELRRHRCSRNRQNVFSKYTHVTGVSCTKLLPAARTLWKPSSVRTQGRRPYLDRHFAGHGSTDVPFTAINIAVISGQLEVFFAPTLTVHLMPPLSSERHHSPMSLKFFVFFEIALGLRPSTCVL